MANYRNIGKMISVFGFKGELVIRHHLGKKTALPDLEAIFIEGRKDEMLPYFIESVRIKSGEEIYIKLEGIDNRETARRLLQQQVWLTEEAFHRYAGKSAPISLVGYHLISGETDLGEILEVIEQPHQVLCRIQWQQKEVLVPLNEATLRKKDDRHKKIFVILPEGLLDIYTG